MQYLLLSICLDISLCDKDNLLPLFNFVLNYVQFNESTRDR